MSMPKRGSPGTSWMTKNQPSWSPGNRCCRPSPRALLDGEVEAEEAQVGIDLGAEQRELELLVELVGRQVRCRGSRSLPLPSSMAFCA